MINSETSKYIVNIKNSYVVSDNMEIGYGNKILLWMFEMMY